MKPDPILELSFIYGKIISSTRKTRNIPLLNFRPTNLRPTVISDLRQWFIFVLIDG